MRSSLLKSIQMVLSYQRELKREKMEGERRQSKRASLRECTEKKRTEIRVPREKNSFSALLHEHWEIEKIANDLAI